MSESFQSRLKELIRKAGGQDELAERSGVPKNTIAKYAVGRSEPNVTRLLALSRAGGVSTDWLIGEGAEERRESAGSYNTDVLSTEYTLIPRLDVEVSAGGGAVVDNDEAEMNRLAFVRKYLRKRGIDPEKARLVTARGDSMEPTISDGDTLLVDTSVHELRADSIYCIQVDGTLRAKRVQRDMRGGVWVISDNPQYEDEHLTAAEAADLKIAGRVVWIGRDV